MGEEMDGMGEITSPVDSTSYGMTLRLRTSLGAALGDVAGRERLVFEFVECDSTSSRDCGRLVVKDNCC